MTLQFKIQLRGITKPTVWRRIVVPGTFTFHQLHQTIQEGFGWYDEHLYQFQRHPYDQGWCIMDPERESGNDIDYKPINARKTVVAAFLKMRALDKFVYVYDFGDDWIHDITLEKVDEEATLEHPVCITGKGACPPEDCGGIYGYEEMKEVFANQPKSKRAKEYREWLMLEKNEKFDPSYFDLEETNDILHGVPYYEYGYDDGYDDDEDYDDEEYDECEELDDDFGFGESFHKLMERPGNIKLVDVMRHVNKATIIEQAEDMHIKLNPRLSEENIKKQFAEKLLADPVALLRQLPLQELRILKNLLDEPTEGNLVECYGDFFKPILVYYDIFGDWFDLKNVNYYVQIPDDLWQAVKPHVKAVLDDFNIQRRIGYEAVVEGLCNIYGQVTRDFVKKELVRLGDVATLEEADSLLNEVREQSVFLKFIEHNRYKGDEATLYLSRYGWDIPGDLTNLIKKNNIADNRLFTSIEIIMAARNPCPIIPNPQEETFKAFLSEELHLDEWEVIETCHRLWYYYMQQDNDFEERPSAGEYFAKDVLHECDGMNRTLFLKALQQLDQYLNNLPHWQLRGHTPAETNTLLSKCAEDSDLRKLATEIPTPNRHPHMLDNDYAPSDWLVPTMPIVMPKTPGRNDPCPCGSGKKYKHCCGRGN